MSVDGDITTPSARVSMDTTVNINEDVASEYSHDSARKPVAGSVTSNFQGSGGEESMIQAFNILKFGYADDEKPHDSVSPLGPNSIYELTSASDVARLRQNKPLKAYISVNGGANTVYNLTKPTSRDIPQIQLQSLKHKVSSKRLSQELVKDMASDYESFEHTNRKLTEAMLNRLSGAGSGPVAAALDDSKLDIPEVFENADFRLDDPRIFRQVMENTQILPDPESHDSTHIIQNTEVQEKLSQYLDRVEVELIQEISKTSDSFFSTLGEIQGIKSQSASSIDQFRVIKQKVDSIEQNQARCGLKILDLLDERQNVCHLESSVLQLKETIDWFHKAEYLFSKGSHSECLDSILIIENLINGTPREEYPDSDTFQQYPQFDYPLVSLASVPALTPIKNNLYMLKQSCSRGYIESFVNLLLEDLESHYNSVSPTDTMNRIYRAIDPHKSYATELNTSYTNVPANVKEQLKNFIKNLYKSNQLIEAFSDYQNKIITEVKGIIRANLPSSGGKLDALQLEASSNPDSRDSSIPPESLGDVTASASSSLSNNLKSLSPEEYTNTMKTTFANLSECFRRLTIHQKLLLDLSLSVVAPNDTLDVMSLDITNAINRAIEITQVRLVKISNVRSEQLCDLSVSEYLHLFALSSGYLSECEFINPAYNSTSPGSSFNDWVKNHVGYYVHRLHSSSLKRFVSSCDKETWKECTDSNAIASSQALLNEILDYSRYKETEGKEGKNGKEWSKLLMFYKDDTTKTESVVTADNQANTKLRIGEDDYMIPELILGVIDTVRDFVIISSIFSSRASTIKSNIMTYFKVMNSRISQAILNAGATRTAGLKHITTKHLALCIQTIEFLHALLSSVQYIYLNVADNVENQQGIEPMTFARVISNYKDHENELFSKLVSIMKDRTVNHCNEIVKIDWSEPLKPGQQCHRYMEILVKETGTVAKVLSKYLRETEYSFILSQIFDNYKKLLLNCFCSDLPQFKDFNEKHSLLKDIDFFRVKLGEIPGYGNSGQVIWENVNALPTIEDSKMEEIMRNNIEGERARAARLAEEQERQERASQETPAPVEEAKVNGVADISNGLVTERDSVEGAKEIPEVTGEKDGEKEEEPVRASDDTNEEEKDDEGTEEASKDGPSEPAEVAVENTSSTPVSGTQHSTAPTTESKELDTATTVSTEQEPKEPDAEAAVEVEATRDGAGIANEREAKDEEEVEEQVTPKPEKEQAQEDGSEAKVADTTESIEPTGDSEESSTGDTPAENDLEMIQDPKTSATKDSSGEESIEPKEEGTKDDSDGADGDSKSQEEEGDEGANEVATEVSPDAAEPIASTKLARKSEANAETSHGEANPSTVASSQKDSVKETVEDVVDSGEKNEDTTGSNGDTAKNDEDEDLGEVLFDASIEDDAS